MTDFNYSFELHEFEEALTPYGTIETRVPTQTTLITDDFREGEHFRTAAEPETNYLMLQLEDRILTLLLDESGSMTWNDHDGDRYTYYKRLLTKLEATYPGSITANLIGFGGIPTKTNLFIAEAGLDFLTSTNQNFDQFLQQTFQDSVYDFAGVRIVRRTDRFPVHPADGVVVAEGILEAVKDENLQESQTYYYGIWTFNKNNHFGAGQFVKSSPTDRILPQGVNFASALPRILPGVERDTNTQLIYNFQEGSGYLVFDSSGYGRHGTVGSEVVEHNFWTGDSASESYFGEKLKKPVGVRFDGEYDIIETAIDSDFVPSTSKTITVNFWLFRYSSTQDQWVIGVSTQSITNNIAWAIGVDSSGATGIQVGDISGGFTAVGGNIPIKTWTMITVKISQPADVQTRFDIYLNGGFSGTITLGTNPNSEVDALYVGAKPITSAASWSGIDYFGSLAQLSIHDTSRSNDYIADLYQQELLLFNQSLTAAVQIPSDNKQREVLLSWQIGDDFDFENGMVKIIRKYKSIPAHIEDGKNVLTRIAEVGEFYYVDTYDFVHNADYYYRIFTTNSLGNICERAEARILPVHIQQSINEEDPYFALLPVSNESIIVGNKKIYLEWTNPSEDAYYSNGDYVGTKIFFHNKIFPSISISANGTLQVSNGIELLDTTRGYYVHRSAGKSAAGTDISIVNGTSYYYTIITYDRWGRISDPKFLMGVPSSQLDTVFLPDEVKDLHIEILNPTTLSIQWENPTIRTEDLDLYFGESALVFVSVRDLFGGDLEDIINLKLQVCTQFEGRGMYTSETELGTGGGGGDTGASAIGAGVLGDVGFGVRFDPNCNTEQEERETVLAYATVQSGLIKGLLTHANDREILSRREKYWMDIRAQYKVEDKEAGGTDNILFEFNTKPVRASFKHPITISVINKLFRFIWAPPVGCQENQKLRGKDACVCDEEDFNICEKETYNGGYIGASRPYICRVEIQYKGESLPDGTPISVELFKHGSRDDPNPLTEKSDRTFIQEGLYSTTARLQEEIDGEGEPTGKFISKSFVDIEILHPSQPDFVDFYVTLDYLGFFVDAVHEIRFIGSVFITTDVGIPAADGIDTSEQFATVHVVNPDLPDDMDRRLPAPDGTLVKWELVKLLFGKDRPFYSTEPLAELLSGVYSMTTSGVARNVFFGPIGNIENHYMIKQCASGETIQCCVGEEYAIKASVILGEESASDGMKFNYPCKEEAEFSNKRFLMNADPDQSHAGGPQANPHWIAWGDGTHMLKFQIAKNPSTSQILGADCFRVCVESQVGGQLFTFPEDHIIQITAPGEILWDVTFDEDPYTGEQTIAHIGGMVSPKIAEQLGIPFVANIPLRGETTDFYVRLNAFIGDEGGPKPKESGNDTSPCEWKNICQYCNECSPTQGHEWDGVSIVSGTSTLIVNNKEVSLFGGGTYEDGIPPIYAGFREPLDVRIIDARVNGERVDELLVNGTAIHTFTIEVKFSNESVPDGTPIELSVEGANEDIVRIMGGQSKVYARQLNDPIVNPQNDDGSVPQRSFAYFGIEPLPDVVFNAKINVTCRYDKLGTAEREITECIEVNNTINVSPPDTPPGSDPVIIEAASSNEAIVYDTVDNLYETTRAAQVRRMGQFAAPTTLGTVDLIFVFGGFTGSGNSATSGITPISERFNSTLQEWEYTTDMPTARAYGMTVTHNGKIYCIGGVELDPLLSQYIISRKIEAFDIDTELWNITLSPLPDNYSVAYGDAQVKDEYIYVTCGITSIDNSSQPGDMNDKILRYSIIDDIWEMITPSDENLYKRLAPFAFLRNPTNSITEDYYIYGGSIVKLSEQIEAERNNQVNKLLDEFRSFILTSGYYQNLTIAEQEEFVEKREKEIRDGVVIPAFIYPATGFRFTPGDETGTNELTIDISTTIDDEWRVLPKPRAHGQCVYIPHQDIAYFIGGSNQRSGSTTLNRVESIDLQDGSYTRLKPMNRGRAMFSAVNITDDIYLLGGFTSGHKQGYVQIDIQQYPEHVEARGIESSGILLTLKNDSGEIIDEDIRVDVRGRLRMPEIDSVLGQFLADRAADRATGGQTVGSDDEFDPQTLFEAQNRIDDPNSDEFQFSAARKLNEEVSLFPILYSQNEFLIQNGVGGVTLLPRSEDPLVDFQKLSEYIKERIANTPEDPDEKFEGDMTREELAALGDALATIKLPPTIVDSGSLRDLYEIETVVTILDDYYFGQTVSEFDLDVQEEIYSRIKDKLTPPEEDEEEIDTQSGVGLGSGGSTVKDSPCFLLQHSAQPDIPSASTPPQSRDPTNPAGTGGFAQSGHCLFCTTVLPLNTTIREQLPTLLAIYYNSVDWMPQVKKRLIDNLSTIPEVITELDIIDHEVPFGASQLYNSMYDAGRALAGDDFDDKKKVIYIASDNSQNLSLITRTQAIEEINSIDGNRKVPVVYSVFSTSFPVSLAAQLQRSGVGDVEKITQGTGGQSTTLISASFMDQISNLAIGSATGGLGYGTYIKQIDFGELSAITAMTLTFILPSNTQGFVRYRYSTDGFNFTDFSERYQGNQRVDFADFFAKVVEIEVVLTTGFTADITEEYDTIATGIPKMVSIVWEISGEREDFMYLDTENALTNAQQVASAFEGSVPINAIIEIGVATSVSHDWRDFQSAARPAIKEFGKTFLLERTDDPFSLVPIETLTTIDNRLYTSSYGPWDPTANVSIIKITTDANNKTETPVLSGFSLYPREGEIYFNTRQSPEPGVKFKIAIINDDILRVGVRLRNRLHTESVSISGIGFIYSTNEVKAIELSQVSPRAINVMISPQTPNAGDTIFALYDYIDLNGDPEQNSIISWHKNGMQLLEIQNKTSWTSNNLLPGHELEPGDKITFAITPCDGRDYGSTIFSSAVTIVAREPGAEDLRIVPYRNSVINSRYDTSSTFTVEYDFQTEDIGAAAIEHGTIIRWFVNGQLFKEGIFSEIESDPYSDPKSILPTEVQGGIVAQSIGNQVYVEVTPKTITITGKLIRSTTITIENSIPIAKNVILEPLTPTAEQTLVLSYEIDDLDIENGDQTDQTEIKWYKAITGVAFAEVTELAGEKTAPPYYIRAGEQWYVQIVPYDGLDLGPTTLSNTVSIYP